MGETEGRINKQQRFENKRKRADVRTSEVFEKKLISQYKMLVKVLTTEGSSIDLHINFLSHRSPLDVILCKQK